MTNSNGKVVAFPGKRVRRRMQAVAQMSFRDKLVAFIIKVFSTPPPALWLCSPSCCVCLSELQTEAYEARNREDEFQLPRRLAG